MPTYLARNGKTFGPFTDPEISGMKMSGEFFKYEWLFDGSTPDWSRVPPPAPPPPMPASAVASPLTTEEPAPRAQIPAAAAIAAPVMQQSAPSPQAEVSFPPRPSQQQQQPRPQPQTTASSQTATIISGKQFQAICHDFHHLISGTATEVSKSGCELVCNDAEHPPALGAKSKAWMDLLDEPSDQSVTIRVTLDELTKRDGRYVYKVSWENCPLI